MEYASDILTDLVYEGYAPAIYYIGMMHFRGEHLDPDRRRGAERIIDAAEKGYPNAYRFASRELRSGGNVDADPALADRYESLAIGSGSLQAIVDRYRRTGSISDKSVARPVDFAKARPESD